jgi:hypothetical protein
LLQGNICKYSNVFRPQKALEKARIKLYSTPALPALLYGSETWTVEAREARRITATEMKYMRITAGYSWTDHKANKEMAKELNITPVLDKIQGYNTNWTHHVNRTPRNRLVRVLENCTPKGRGTRGRQ